MRILLTCFLFASTFSLTAQQINYDIFQKNIEILYDAAAKGFKDIKTEETGVASDGQKKFHSSRKVSGASEVYIKVDSEDSHTYVALFEADDIDKAKAEIEKMVSMSAEQLAEKGLVRKKGTEMRYDGYRKHTIEYDSDNIDLMGKYPSFEFGILRDSEPPIIEMVINEPLWK